MTRDSLARIRLDSENEHSNELLCTGMEVDSDLLSPVLVLNQFMEQDYQCKK